MYKVTVSIIMGIYNTKKKEFLEKSLNSILNQTYNNYELIICDDGSTNECMKWAKEICAGDKRVVFIKNEKNEGLAYTLNQCLEIAKGEYIARMDDDDESALNRLERQINFLKNHKEVDLVSSNINLFDDTGIYGEEKYPEYITKEDFLFNSPIVHPAIMARKKAFDIVGGYRNINMTIRVEDYDLFMRMFAKKVNMYVIQENLLYYRADRENTRRRKKYRYRINEAKVRYFGFKMLDLLPKGYIYILKPLILGLIPIDIIRKIKRR